MSLEILKMVITVLDYIALGVYILATPVRIFSVKGSRQHYVTTTWSLAAAVALVGIHIVYMGIDFIEGKYPSAGLDFFLVLLWLWTVKWISKNDNWFNDQWKRAKRSLKKLRQRLSALAPRPLPLPA